MRFVLPSPAPPAPSAAAPGASAAAVPLAPPAPDDGSASSSGEDSSSEQRGQASELQDDATVRVSAKAKAKSAAAGIRAPPRGQYFIGLHGRTFIRLKRGGLSLECKHHKGQHCFKDCGFGTRGEPLNEHQVMRRLLAWEYAGRSLDRASHCSRRFGGALLAHFADH